MSQRGRMIWIEHEPCCINADTVVALLKRIGWREAADLIERMNERDAAQYLGAQAWRTAYEELRQKYEPESAPTTPTSSRPDWTCDG